MNRNGWMSSLTIVAALGSGCASAPADQAVPGDPGHVSLLLGGRSFDDDWSPVEDQGAIGIEADWRPSDWLVGFEVGATFSSEDDEGRVSGFGNVDAEATFYEVYAGARASFGSGKLHPYLGAGITLLVSDVEVEAMGLSDSDTDGSAGVYAHGGLLFDVTEALVLGLDVRGVGGTDLDFEGIDADADYVQAALVLGWSF